ncbi:MAG: alkane 1-monooxygenase [Gammaproteobacteria bacterium]|nr:alkane 1-monooxygenase [Gammaproteobacteria bacterium]
MDVRLNDTTDEYHDKKRYYWLLSLLWPTVPLFGICLASLTDWSIFYWLLPVEFYLLIPWLDEWLGDDTNNPPESAVPGLEADRYYRFLTWLTVPLHYLTMTVVCWVIVKWSLSIIDIIGLTLSLGLINSVAINTAHELGHKHTRFEQWLAKIALAVVAYGHFTIEHNRGHHADVATPEDSASARMGESIYAFSLREIPGGIKRSWALESARLQRQGIPRWGRHNELLQTWLMTLIYYAVLIVWLGMMLLPVLLVQAIIAWFQLTTANYVEHYGLLRQKDERGNYQPCKPEHSWNSNRSLSNLIFYNLQRHSDHHANAGRRYQALRSFSGVPELPGGYPKMFLVALFPGWWRRMMDPILLKHYQGNTGRINSLTQGG